MSHILFLYLIFGVILLGAQSPSSSGAHEGKTVYISIPKPIDLDQEKMIQQADQNITQHGGRP